MVSTFEFADNVVGIMIDSNLDEDLMREVHQVVSLKLEEHKKINLFFELQSGNKMSVLAMLKDLNFKFNHLGQFNKITIVTDLFWLQHAMAIKDIVMPAEISIFSSKERVEGLDWIAS